MGKSGITNQVAHAWSFCSSLVWRLLMSAQGGQWLLDTSALIVLHYQGGNVQAWKQSHLWSSTNWFHLWVMQQVPKATSNSLQKQQQTSIQRSAVDSGQLGPSDEGRLTAVLSFAFVRVRCGGSRDIQAFSIVSVVSRCAFLRDAEIKSFATVRGPIWGLTFMGFVHTINKSA